MRFTFILLGFTLISMSACGGGDYVRPHVHHARGKHRPVRAKPPPMTEDTPQPVAPATEDTVQPAASMTEDTPQPAVASTSQSQVRVTVCDLAKYAYRQCDAKRDPRARAIYDADNAAWYKYKYCQKQKGEKNSACVPLQQEWEKRSDAFLKSEIIRDDTEKRIACEKAFENSVKDHMDCMTGQDVLDWNAHHESDVSRRWLPGKPGKPKKR